jgi:RNA-binding protein
MLSGKQLSRLRGMAHHRKVIVTVGGAGLTRPVLSEIDGALKRHELIKIRLPSVEKASRVELLDEICKKAGANRVQIIGRCGVLYRPADPPKIDLAD